MSCLLAMKENHPYLLLMAPSGDGRFRRCTESRVAAGQQGEFTWKLAWKTKKELQVIKQDLVPLFKLLLGERLGESQAESTLLTELPSFFSLFSLQKLSCCNNKQDKQDKANQSATQRLLSCRKLSLHQCCRLLFFFYHSVQK